MNLFGILEQLDRNNPEIYEALEDDTEGLAEFEKNIGWLIPQWLTGAEDEGDHAALILRFEALANPSWSLAYRNPRLAAKVLSQVGLGRRTRHKFYRPTASKRRAAALTEVLRADYPDIREHEVVLWCKDNTEDALHAYLDSLGVPKDQRKKIIEEYKRCTRL